MKSWPSSSKAMVKTLPFGPGPRFAATQDLDDARIFENGEVELHRDFGVGIEPKEGNNFLSVFKFHSFAS